MKKLLTIVFASAFALTLAAPIASACPGSESTIAKDKKESKEKNDKKDEKQVAKEKSQDSKEKKDEKAKTEPKPPVKVSQK